MITANIPAQLGKYEIRGVLGRGAMGVVYDGWDPLIHRRVAIKTIRLPDTGDEEAAEGFARFRREAQAAGRLTHPNIVGVFDYAETDELAFIVMEFVEGRSLKEVLDANERMAAPEVMRLMGDVLAGLAYSHGRGVVHRDIKPANIMLTAEDQAKIADFGIARIEASSMTQAGTVMGTPAYMSPEQFMGQTVDRRTDIYSCGVMLYQLLTGERPFEGSMTSIMHKAMTTTPPRPSELAVTAPPALDTVVAKAMARRPEDRFDTAADFAKALRAPPVPPTDDGDGTVVLPRPVRAAAVQAVPAPAPARTRSRIPFLVVGGVAALAVAGAAAWMLAGQAEAPRQSASIRPPPAEAAPAAPIMPASPPVLVPAVPPAASPASSPAAGVQAGPTPSLVPESATPPPAAPPSATLPPAASPLAAPPMPGPASQQTASITQPTGLPTAPAPIPVVATLLHPARFAASLDVILRNLPCNLAHADVASDGIILNGVIGAPGMEALRRAIPADSANITWQVQEFDGPYCPVLDLLRALPDAAPGGLTLRQDGGPAPLRDNQVIALQAAMPGFAGFLHVAYVQHDALAGAPTVAPLIPGPGYPAQTFPARAAIPLGTPRAGSPGWTVGPPFGTDMIVAVASTAPLFARPLPDSQPLPAYLSGLQAAIDDLRRRGGTVSATVAVLETRPAGR